MGATFHPVSWQTASVSEMDAMEVEAFLPPARNSATLPRVQLSWMP
jgi:hypothetical protein